MQTKYDELARLAEASIKIDTSPWPSKNDFIELFGQWDAAFMEAANPATIKAMHADMVAMAEALEGMVNRIEHYASLKADGVPNIEDWAYTDQSGDMQRARAALARVKGETK